MSRFRKKKNIQGASKGTHKKVPVTRYYKPRSNPSDRTSTNKKEKIAGNSQKVVSFIKQLPQRLLVIAFVVLIIANTTVSSVRVKLVDNNDNTYRAKIEYDSGVLDIINNSIYNKSKLTLSSASLEEEIQEMFPEVSSAAVVVPLAGRKLQVGLRLDSPLLRLTKQGTQQGIVGKTGKLLILTDTKSILDTFSSLPSMILEPNIDFAVGDQVLTTSETELITLLLAEFDSSEPYRYSINSLLFLVEKREMQVRFNGVSYFAKLTPERTAREQVGALVAVTKQIESNKSKKPTRYVDVRVEGRVYTK